MITKIKDKEKLRALFLQLSDKINVENWLSPLSISLKFSKFLVFDYSYIGDVFCFGQTPNNCGDYYFLRGSNLGINNIENQLEHNFEAYYVQDFESNHRKNAINRYLLRDGSSEMFERILYSSANYIIHPTLNLVFWYSSFFEICVGAFIDLASAQDFARNNHFKYMDIEGVKEFMSPENGRDDYAYKDMQTRGFLGRIADNIVYSNC